MYDFYSPVENHIKQTTATVAETSVLFLNGSVVNSACKKHGTWCCVYFIGTHWIYLRQFAELK